MHVLAILLLIVAAQTVRIGGVPTVPNGIVAPPTVATFTYPAYTDEARNRKVEGVVTVEAAFDTNGTPTVIRVVKGLGFGLDENAINVLKDWRFLPATRNGERVSVVAQVDVEFKLQNDWFKVGSGVTPPQVTDRVNPQYTPEAKRLGLSGTVVVEAIVREDGSLKVMRVLRSVDPALDESAIKALEQWKFKSGTRDGKSVNVKLNLEVNFKLNK
jgi:TonB family protein